MRTIPLYKKCFDKRRATLSTLRFPLLVYDSVNSRREIRGFRVSLASESIYGLAGMDKKCFDKSRATLSTLYNTFIDQNENRFGEK